MRVLMLWLFVLCAALPVAAQQSAAFPRGGKFILHMTSSQDASGMADYLINPLADAFEKAGMRPGGIDAPFAVSVETGSDVGQWYGKGDARQWLYKRFVTVGLSPAEIDIEPEGKLRPAFAVKTVLITPNEDRVDELNCLIALATRELAARYVPKGQVTVDGQSCARR
ncbi:MAG: hypothetical protein KDK26_13800 [Roseivivax sp.]|nr:hypothetical protein [Roseivivax sp.]